MESVKLDVSVTAICHLEKYPEVVIAGVGNCIEIFESCRLIRSFPVFESTSSSIHGFVESNCSTKILVFGGKNVEILNLTNFRGANA